MYENPYVQKSDKFIGQQIRNAHEKLFKIIVQQMQ